MSNLRFQAGEVVWWATHEVEPEHLTCPHCGGTGRLRITFHDDTEASIDCANCSVGYDPPTGIVTLYGHKARANKGIVTGFSLDAGKVEWRIGDFFIVQDEDVFQHEAEALARAAEMAEKHNERELTRTLSKEKDTRSWAWNASYHRNQIKDAEKKIEYHRAKLNVAALKAKEERKAKP